ncbi:MAG: hypothetical protein M1814_005622 [Vezdaea aestivalis]|nr:MAG: hypothetical protein M1814_005622 [Vezdaea aestivalis]
MEAADMFRTALSPDQATEDGSRLVIGPMASPIPGEAFDLKTLETMDHPDAEYVDRKAVDDLLDRFLKRIKSIIVDVDGKNMVGLTSSTLVKYTYLGSRLISILELI